MGDNVSFDELLNVAYRAFEAERYEDTLRLYAELFRACEDDDLKSEVFEFINESFIAPNENEFRDAYSDNLATLNKIGLKTDEAPSYEELSFLFIPVSDTRYFVWDKEEKRFASVEPIDISNVGKMEAKKSFDSILIDDFASFDQIVTKLTEFEYRYVYLVFNGDKRKNLFYTYMLLPGVSLIFKGDIVCLNSPEELSEHLWETGHYIPRTRIVTGEYDYALDMAKLHEKRIRNPKKTKPFLSIMIPTRNHGDKALENVKHILECDYDEEIEINVSNNGSIHTLDEYEKIRELSEIDSRVIYKKYPHSIFFHTSIWQVMALTSGEFMVLCSDEDELNKAVFYDSLQHLYENRNKGGVLFRLQNDAGDILYDDYESTDDVFDATLSAFCINYITGITYNSRLAVQNKRSEHLFEKYVDNTYYNTYPHCVLFANMVCDTGMAAGGPIAFFKHDGSKKENAAIYEKYKMHYSYMELDNRLQCVNDEIKILVDMNLSRDITIGIAVEMQDRLYTLLYGAYYCHPEEMRKDHSWEECCEIIYKNNLKMWEDPYLKKLCVGDMSERIKQVMKKYYEIHLKDEPKSIND